MVSAPTAVPRLYYGQLSSIPIAPEHANIVQDAGFLPKFRSVCPGVTAVAQGVCRSGGLTGLQGGASRRGSAKVHSRRYNFLLPLVVML